MYVHTDPKLLFLQGNMDGDNKSKALTRQNKQILTLVEYKRRIEI